MVMVVAGVQSLALMVIRRDCTRMAAVGWLQPPACNSTGHQYVHGQVGWVTHCISTDVGKQGGCCAPCACMTVQLVLLL